ncbi:uncharacterized protein LOC106642773 [Copidosoma floridanum]|uniref:uncharacterized protein LOC106642773 n=1 Tax=Copidosoma floridanum TaxID=29053 RepID=UPI0006C9DA47|nr:uncharacterized protein LOC106642773 [Copidosoma floridanum]
MIFLWNSSPKDNLMEIIIKSFYIHYSGIMILVDKNWFQGLLNFFLTLSVFGINNRSLQSKAIEIFSVHAVHLLLSDIFRLSYLQFLTHNKEFKKAHPRFPYLYYLLVWSFLCLAHTLLHVISVPFNQLYLRYEDLFFPVILLELRLIFSWELWLFPIPSSESLHLKSILSNFRNQRKTAEKTSLKKQIWQTLICTMVMKKKINRLKKAKQAKAENLNLSNEHENS